MLVQFIFYLLVFVLSFVVFLIFFLIVLLGLQGCRSHMFDNPMRHMQLCEVMLYQYQVP